MADKIETHGTYMTVTTEEATTVLINSPGKPFPVRLPPKSRKLTSGEIALARLIFKESIPYEKVRIVRGGLLGIPDNSRNAMTPFGEIHLPIKVYDVIKDFSGPLTNKEDNQRWFIHEMTHIWQYFAMDLSVACRGVRLASIGGYTERDTSGRLMAYAYDLLGIDRGKEFKDFNIEQQADIVCHYYLVKYHANYVSQEPQLRNLISQQSRREYVLRDFLRNPLDRKLKSEEWTTEIHHHREEKNNRIYIDAVTKVRTF